VVQTTKGTGPGSSFALTADQVTVAVPDGNAKGAKGKIRKASVGGAGAQQ
jgi:hypothetical protein